MSILHRGVLAGFAVLVACGAATAQQAASPTGTWRTDAIIVGGGPNVSTLELTVGKVEADQRVTARYVVYSAGVDGGNACRTVPVTGSFDGSALKMSSPATNLCPDRVFNLKAQGDQLAGTIVVGGGNPLEVKFNRR